MTSTELCSRLRLVVAIGLLVALPSLASAQTLGFGYTFSGPVAVDNIGLRDAKTAWQFGGGGEVLTGPKSSIGGEVGWVSFPAVDVKLGCCGSGSAPAYNVALLSFNGSFHILGVAPTRRLQPFVTGGLTLIPGEVMLWNAGGGLNWWLGRRAGIRLDVRDHLLTTSALFGIRVGVIFR